jgi:hypothetical protein
MKILKLIITGLLLEGNMLFAQQTIVVPQLQPTQPTSNSSSTQTPYTSTPIITPQSNTSPVTTNPADNVTLPNDVIKLKDGGQIACYIINVTDIAIEYTAAYKSNNIVYSQPLSTVVSINYKDGSVRNFINPNNTQNNSYYYQPNASPTDYQNSNLESSIQLSPISAEVAYFAGQKDARLFYTKYKGAGTGTFLVSLLLGPILGLIPAIACSSIPPSIMRLDIPVKELSKDPNYLMGYKAGAKKQKNRKVWTNFGIGSGIAVMLLIIAS